MVSTHALRLHLLVVDDDDVDRERVLRLLARSPLQFDSMEADSSGAALQLLREHAFDCVMLDNQLGDASGAELLPMLMREARQTCPVIMITGAGNEALAVRALQHGASDYLAKTHLDSDTLARAIERALERHRLRSELDELHLHLERRVQEQTRFSDTVFDCSPAGHAVFDAQGLCVKCNQTLAAWLGGPAAALVGQSLAALLPGAEGLFAAAEATRADGSLRRVAVAAVSPWGCTVQADCAMARIEHEGQAHLLLAVQDTAEQQRVLADLVAARNAAEAAARAKSAFLANMSHEIRTPMNAVIGLSRLALEDVLPPSARDYLDKSYHAALALMGILDDVLDYSKIEAGQMRFEQLPFELEKTVQRVVDLFGPRIAQKGLDWVVDLEEGLPTQVVGDPLRLSQVLNNLVGNAAKFTEQGYIRLSVSRHRVQGVASGLLRFEVQDTGIGIEHSQRSELFEAFAQGDNSITRRFGGTGLGLTISRRLIELMGGEVGVESRPGQGSEFWFTARLPQAPGAPALPAGPDLAGMSVLLVEPHAVIADMVSLRLQAWHARVTLCPDLAGAVEALLRARNAGLRHDVVLLEWPGAAGGGAALQQLRTAAGRHLALPVVAMSPSPIDSRHGAAATHAFPDATLIKPVQAPALLACLQNLQRQRALGVTNHLAAGVPPPSMSLADHWRERGLPLRGMRVLLVEDNELNRLVACGFLHRMGLDVCTAEDGAEALAVLGQPGPPIDLVLMDLHMPVMDGLEATRRIRATAAFARLPIIGMTAAVLPEDRARCLQAGMDEHLTKPIVPDQLLDALLARFGH